MYKPDDERRLGFKGVIKSFLQERLEGKLKQEEDPAKQESLRTQYAPESWIADATRRVGQIQAVTHTLKATHPDAKGSSMYCIPDSTGREDVVGSHQLAEDFTFDTVGNAAALDVDKFLRCEYMGTSLLDWMRKEDGALLATLHADETLARKWMDAFLELIRQPESPSSHTYAKQLYWLVGDDPADDEHYHLMAPLYGSSLAHKIFAIIKEDQETRHARRNGVYSDQILHEYPNLAVQKFGGSKPQNISRLNSERRGKNYLLASLPPVWRTTKVRPPWGRHLFEQFGHRCDVAQLVTDLKTFLESDPAPTLATRERRDNLLDQIIGEVLQYASELRELEPGWSADSRCHLTEAEKLWLDPGHVALNTAFAEAWEHGQWKTQIPRQFAVWLNHALGEHLPLGDIEYAFWADALDMVAWQRQIVADPPGNMETKEASDA